MRCAATCDSGAGERGLKDKRPETLSQVLSRSGLFARHNYLQSDRKSQAAIKPSTHAAERRRVAASSRPAPPRFGAADTPEAREGSGRFYRLAVWSKNVRFVAVVEVMANFCRSARCARQSAAVFNATKTTSAKSGEPSSMTIHPPNSTVKCSTMTRPYGCAPLGPNSATTSTRHGCT